MNPRQREQWVDEVLKEVLTAVVRAPELREALVFKGAWILNHHLKDDRHSMDIDAAAAPEWVGRLPELSEQEAFLRKHMPAALHRHFEQQSPVRFELEDCRVIRNPPERHPRRWDMWRVRLRISDRRFSNIRGLPPAELEISAPELFGPEAIERCDLLGAPARIYSLHRIAGEKLRAYLTSLPAYRRKMGDGEREFRVKDLHDLARITRATPTESQRGFWAKAAREFQLACQSRYVDCAGPETFKQEWTQARLRYEQDQNLRKISFQEAEAALDAITALFASERVFPLIFALPPI